MTFINKILKNSVLSYLPGNRACTLPGTVHSSRFSNYSLLGYLLILIYSGQSSLMLSNLDSFFTNMFLQWSYARDIQTSPSPLLTVLQLNISMPLRNVTVDWHKPELDCHQMSDSFEM